MTAKEQLRQITTIDQRISSRIALIERYMEQAERMEHALNRISVQSSTDPSPMETCVCKALDLANDIRAEVEQLREERRITMETVSCITNARHRQVLELRYMSGVPTPWTEIAEVMQTDIRWVFRLHGYALKDFSCIASKDH